MARLRGMRTALLSYMGPLFRKSLFFLLLWFSCAHVAEAQNKIGEDVHSNIINVVFGSLPIEKVDLRIALEQRASLLAEQPNLNSNPAVDPDLFLTASHFDWGKIGRQDGALYSQPGQHNTHKLATLKSGGRFLVISQKQIKNGEHITAWFKIVPFDCHKLELENDGDPNMKPEESCNQAFWITSTNFHSTFVPKRSEIIARSASHSLTEAIGGCDGSCNTPQTEARDFGDQVEASVK